MMVSKEQFQLEEVKSIDDAWLRTKSIVCGVGPNLGSQWIKIIDSVFE